MSAILNLLKAGITQGCSKHTGSGQAGSRCGHARKWVWLKKEDNGQTMVTFTVFCSHSEMINWPQKTKKKYNSDDKNHRAFLMDLTIINHIPHTYFIFVWFKELF